MKAIFLVDSSKKNFEEVARRTKTLPSCLEDSTGLEEDSEYNHLFQKINRFVKTTNKIMLVRFSGNEKVAKTLGDERPEMILAISQNPKSGFYSGSSILDICSELAFRFQNF